MEYKNFELGILLHSDFTSDDIYRALNSLCPIHSTVSNAPGVLPLPFDIINCFPYCVNGEFIETPYLNHTKENVRNCMMSFVLKM